MQLMTESDFTESEATAIQTYIARNVHPMLPMLHLIFTREAVDLVDRYHLFKPIPVPVVEETTNDDSAQAEAAAQEAQLAAAALAQKQAEEAERQRQEALAEIEKTVVESKQRIAEHKRAREEQLAQLMNEAQLAMDSKKSPRKRK